MSGETDNKETRVIMSDPSPLTTQQLWREVQNLKELLLSQITGIQKSIEVAHDDLVRVPTDVQKQVANLKELHDEKFRSIQVQFAERDTRTEQKDRDTKIAIDAAFQSASTAVGKSETGTGKQIEQLQTLIQTEVRGLRDQISDSKETFSGQVNDLKERTARLESGGIGKDVGKAQQQESTKYIIGIIVIVLAVLGFVVGRGLP